jgi:glutamate/tyrosine decarboxylase-like PLP-dependent enzyme
MAPVELSICCFRYVPPSIRKQLVSATLREQEKINAQLDELNTRIMHSIQRGGRVYLSNATIRGRFALRICITNFRTTRADIEFTLDVIRRVAADEVNRATK